MPDISAVIETTRRTEIVDEVLQSRPSVRAFLPTPVPRPIIEDILRVASSAPSGTNTQPWKVVVLTSLSLRQLSEKIEQAHADPIQLAQYHEEYAYYPKEWVSPYIDRRRKVGWDLYGLLNIDKTDKARRQAQHLRNYRFFDAPVGLMFMIDRLLGQGSWLDYGMFLQNTMIAAKARGLDTCPQAAFTVFHQIVQAHLQSPPTEMLVCGMALGYVDSNAIENSLRTEREPVSHFTRFLD